jgi:C1A family cysteine protease
MALTGAQFAAMQAALGSAFRTPAMLRRMLRIRLEVDLDMVAGGDNYGDVLFELITWAESEGRVSELLEKAIEEKPGNVDLQRFVEDYRAVAAKSPPGSVDLSSWVTIHDQGAEGTVAAMATVTAMEASLARQGDPELLSTRWLYWKAKQHDELRGAEGTWLTAVVYCAERFGVPVESAWPYVAGDRGAPPETLDGTFYMARFFRLESLDEVSGQLDLGRPVVAGVNVYGATWFLDQTVASGAIPPPAKDAAIAGAHAVTFVAFRPDDGTLRFANTWGTSWGDAGFGTFGLDSAEAHVVPAQLWAVDVPAAPDQPVLPP